MCDMVRNRQQYIAIRLNTSWALQLCSKCVQPPNNWNSREAEHQTPAPTITITITITESPNTRAHLWQWSETEENPLGTERARDWGADKTKHKIPDFRIVLPPSSQNLWRNDSKYVICHISSIPKMPSRCLPWEHTSNFQFVKHS